MELNANSKSSVRRSRVTHKYATRLSTSPPAEPSPKLEPSPFRDIIPRERSRAQTAKDTTSGFHVLHVPCVTNAAERSNADVAAVGDQTEPRKEPKEVYPSEFADARNDDQGKREKMPTSGPAQTNQERLGLIDTSVREIVSG